MIRRRDTEAEESMKQETDSLFCSVRGNNGIIKDTVDKKLYHFFGLQDSIMKNSLGLHLKRA